LAVLAAAFLCAACATSALAAPVVIEETAVSDVTLTSVILEATVNPGERAGGFHFEYGPADCSSNPCNAAPVPDGTIKKGNAPIVLSTTVSGLQPGTTYHYRLFAHNPDSAQVFSPDRTFTTFSLPPVFEPCANDALRTGPSAHLPDCRAYEQASPIDKNGVDLWSRAEQRAVSVNGDAVAFMSDVGIPGAEGEQNIPTFLASRGPGESGWSTQGVLPPASAGQDAHVVGWTPDLSQFYSTATRKEAEPSESTLLARASAGGALAMLAPYASGPDSGIGYFIAGTAGEGSVVLFETAPNIGGSVGSGKRAVFAWERASGKVTPVGVLNTQAQTEVALAKGAMAGPYNWASGLTTALTKGGPANNYYVADEHALAADGSAAYFTAAGSGDLYVRLNPTAEQSALDGAGNCTEADKACTLRANVSTRTVPDPAGAAPAAFRAASADGTRAFFTSSQMLTDDANTGPEQEAPAIMRSDLDGNPESVEHTFLPTHAGAVAVDSEHVYWLEPKKSTIARAKLNGEEPEDEFITAVEDGKGLTVANGYIYWTNGACEPEKCIPEGKGVTGTIGRAKLNGDGPASEVDQAFIEGAGNPWAVAVNPEYVYWTQSALTNGGFGFISRASTTGAEVKKEFIQNFSNGSKLPGIALDSGHIYWMWENPLEQDNISRANLDGSGYYENAVNNITFVKLAATDTDTTRHGRAIAIEGNHIYWAAEGTSEIGRATLNGDEPASEVELGFIEGASHPRGLAADASHLYWGANVDTPPNPGNDLYRFEARKPAGQRLTDLTPDAADKDGAEVRGVLGTSTDGSYVYFAANGVLAPGATPGDCGGLPQAETGTCNVYLAHGSEIEFIARMAPGNWAPTDFNGTDFESRDVRVSPDGQTLIYGSEGIRRYDAATHSFNCISCNPTGAAPGVSVRIRQPGPLYPAPGAAVLTRSSSSDGKRIFFETTAALVGEDTNGLEGCPKQTYAGNYFYYSCQDVYEWEANGAGSCHSENQNGGCLYLISSGKESDPSFLIGTSASGRDVFIFTRSQLVGQDQDNLRDVYDVRVEGGLAAQNPPPPNPCAGEACKEGTQPPPGAQAAGSQQFNGPGDPPPKRPHCRKPRVLKHGKCVKAAGHKHHRKTKTSGRAGR
jgi:hypothetical protein